MRVHKSMAELDPNSATGCLAIRFPDCPHYHLAADQRAALKAALKMRSEPTRQLGFQPTGHAHGGGVF